jgi:hypothetical protein
LATGIRTTSGRVRLTCDVETLSPELVGSLAITGGLGLLMIRLAGSKDLVERRDEKRCPTCGLLTGLDGRCGCPR